MVVSLSPLCFIALGSNIDPERNLSLAATLLREAFPDITFSSVYKSAPKYREDQPPFLNAVAKVETDKGPKEILRNLRSIEKQLGKSPPFRFGPRTIDLDLLMYDNLILPNLEEWHALEIDPNQQTSKPANQQLVLPHPRMHERRFVLEPLSELLSSEELHPILQLSWGSLLQKTLDQSCDRLPLSL